MDRLTTVRRNIATLLRYGNIVPFNWSTKGFQCFFCAKPMKNCDLLKEHSRKHKIDLDYFVSKRIITKDVPVKVDITDIGCKECPECSIANLEELISHVDNYHGSLDQSAGDCFYPFVLSEDVMKCIMCENKYDNFSRMIGHTYREHVTHHFVCQMCGLSFRDQIRLNRHIQTIHTGHRCTFCGSCFDALAKLEKHKARIHGKVKLYDCGLCSQKFSNIYQVKVHMGKVHNVEKYRIKCEHCPKVVSTKGAMVTHMQSLHSEVRYRCDLCEYTASIKWMVTLHKRKHSGLKEYTCSICERKFGRASNLRAHMKVHTGSTGRVCRICRQGFTDTQTLKMHETDAH